MYASGNRNFLLSEDITAINSDLNLSSLRHTFIMGDARRKQGSGDFTVAFMPTDRWTITNTTSVNNTRISGNSAFLEVTASTSQFQEFEHLGIRHISNASEVNFRAHPTFGVYGAYRFSPARISRAVDGGFSIALSGLLSGGVRHPGLRLTALPWANIQRRFAACS